MEKGLNYDAYDGTKYTSLGSLIVRNSFSLHIDLAQTSSWSLGIQMSRVKYKICRFLSRTWIRAAKKAYGTVLI